MSHYLETSAAAKLLVEEDESAALADFLDSLPHPAGAGERLVSSALLETELRRLAVREGLSQSAVSDVLARIALVEPDRAIFHEAGLLPGARLRSLDAIHLATAVRVDGVVVAYDRRLIDAAESLGLGVVSPRLNTGTSAGVDH